jgi:branched-chain amino acid transport system ATP-binding protein
VTAVEGGPGSVAVTTGAALELDGISKSYGGLEVLRSVTLSIPSSTIYGIAGPNGAGKTTLLNIISGFADADSGRFQVSGVDTTAMDAFRLSRMGVARTFQNIRLFRGMSVREQVSAGAYRHRTASMFASMLRLPSERRDRAVLAETADQMLELVGLSHVADRLAETLSYGDQRRLEIARALATRPNVLLLDEPTAGMNDADWLPIADLLSELRSRGLTVVVIEHNMRLLERCCDRIAVIAAGAVIAEDEPMACLRLPEVRVAYFGK